MRYKIFKDGEEINVIIADEDFVTVYCKENGYTFEADILPEDEPKAPITDVDEMAMAIKEGVNAI